MRAILTFGLDDAHTNPGARSAERSMIISLPITDAEKMGQTCLNFFSGQLEALVETVLSEFVDSRPPAPAADVTGILPPGGPETTAGDPTAGFPVTLCSTEPEKKENP